MQLGIIGYPRVISIFTHHRDHPGISDDGNSEEKEILDHVADCLVVMCIIYYHIVMEQRSNAGIDWLLPI